MQSELLDFKKELHLDVEIGAQYNEVFSEESFFEVAAEQLSEAGVLDDVETCFYRDSQRGIRLDGYSWNDLESTLCLVVTQFSGDPESLASLSKSEILKIANRPKRFLENLQNPKFLSSMDPSTEAHACAKFISKLGDAILKFRVVVVTDFGLSDRIKSISLEPVMDTATSVEIWDLNRFYALSLSDSESEPFEIGPDILGESGIEVIKGADLPTGATAYLGVMPGETLSRIYDEYGQRLLEGNVRTFLDFRGGVNRGLRMTLATEPENFFAYNNGITLTADSATVDQTDSRIRITALQNLQIVNGGQTTAAMYFAPKEKGVIKTVGGDIPYSSIELSKVSIQMKLTIFNDSEKEQIDEYRANISKYANSQNSVQDSDLVSNHPIHLNIERLSRQILMPADDSGLASKWFYERTRGQYSTRLRALSSSGKKKFQLEFPKPQLFTKTDMAKYENTWRMNPHKVKKGAQANLKALGPALIKEFEAEPDTFEAGFYRDLIAKAILFKATDKAVLKSEWYKQESGLKAEAVAFGIALVRKKLLEKRMDINLDRIFSRQSTSAELLDLLIESARLVRKNITDPSFRGGVGNPSEFCKSENGWKRIQTIELDVSRLDKREILNADQKGQLEEQKKELNRVSSTVSDFERIIEKGADYWKGLASHNLKAYRLEDIRVAIPMKAAQMIEKGKILSEKQMKTARRVAHESETAGFAFETS